MKILSIGNFTTGWDGSICDEEHIAKALEDLGHEVARHQRENSFGVLVMDDYDFILIAQWDGYSNICSRLREIFSCPIVYWAFDYQEDNQQWHRDLVYGSDLYLSKRLDDKFLYSDKNWQWLSQDFAPDFLHKGMNVDKDIDVLFTGSYLPWATERTEILKAVDKKYNLTIHSVTPNEWKAQGLKNVEGPIMDDGLPDLYARAKINLSIDHTIEAGYWSDRNAQIMACGGFVLFRYVPLSEVRFGSNISYFSNVYGCLDGIRYFLEVEEDRELLAQAGHKYAQRNLMVHNRVGDLLTIVKERFEF